MSNVSYCERLLMFLTHIYIFRNEKGLRCDLVLRTRHLKYYMIFFVHGDKILLGSVRRGDLY